MIEILTLGRAWLWKVTRCALSQRSTQRYVDTVGQKQGVDCVRTLKGGRLLAANTQSAINIEGEY